MIVTRRTALVTAVMKNNRKLFDLLFEQVVGCANIKHQSSLFDLKHTLYFRILA